MIVQNGIGVEEAYKKRFAANPLISTVAYMPSTRVSGTYVVHMETQRIVLGACRRHTFSGEEETIRGLTDMLEAAGAHAEMLADIQDEQWKKTVGNAT